jgi:hypothetical protein
MNSDVDAGEEEEEATGLALSVEQVFGSRRC